MAKKENKCNHDPKVPICAIKDQIINFQCEHLKKTGRYIGIPRAIVKMIQEKY